MNRRGFFRMLGGAAVAPVVAPVAVTEPVRVASAKEVRFALRTLYSVEWTPSAEEFYRRAVNLYLPMLGEIDTSAGSEIEVIHP